MFEALTANCPTLCIHSQWRWKMEKGSEHRAVVIATRRYPITMMTPADRQPSSVGVRQDSGLWVENWATQPHRHPTCATFGTFIYLVMTIFFLLNLYAGSELICCLSSKKRHLSFLTLSASLLSQLSSQQLRLDRRGLRGKYFRTPKTIFNRQTQVKRSLKYLYSHVCPESYGFRLHTNAIYFMTVKLFTLMAL